MHKQLILGASSRVISSDILDNLFVPGIYSTTIGSYGTIIVNINYKNGGEFTYQFAIDVNFNNLNPRFRLYSPTLKTWCNWFRLAEAT